MIKIKKGLDLPIAGEPVQKIADSPAISRCAVLGQDYVGLKPTMAVREGDQVRQGQVIFSHKNNSALQVTAPISGKIEAINRGAKRVLQSVVIEGDNQSALEFSQFQGTKPELLGKDQIRELLIESGLWASLRERPYNRVPTVDAQPHSIFITAIDTHPLGFDPALVIKPAQQAFDVGVQVLRKLTPANMFLCVGESLAKLNYEGVSTEQFCGPHPAGLPGTHIHMLAPVNTQRSVWFINYQDVIAIGILFTSGQLDTDRVIALAGPQIKTPRLIRVPIGAQLDQVIANDLREGESRIVSGSVLGGREAAGVFGYLSRYHQIVSVLREGRERGFIEYLSLGKDKHSTARIYLSQFAKSLRLPMTTSTNGSERAMVPIGLYEKVMPLDLLPTQLLRALIVGDIESAIELGALELDEEDLALCTYVCPGKYEYGPILRDNLTRIEQEG